ncbi:MAG: zf-TFIIB domain-containing protein [Pseudomonadota bacterium]
MKCPRCPDSTLAMIVRQGIEIDYCPGCRGIWLDRGELDKLIALAAPTFHAASREADTLHSGRYNGDRRGGERHDPYRHTGDDGRRRKSWLNEIFD